MYLRESQTTIFEKYECDACGKKAEFVTEYKRAARRADQEPASRPDTGEWATVGFSVEISDGDNRNREVGGAATYCSKACKDKAIKQAIANCWKES